MNMNNLLPFNPENLVNARCIVCDRYLSVTPILSSSDGKLFKCGRCVRIYNKYVSTRLTILDTIFRFFTFPCIYANCNKQLNFEDIKDHEKNCEKRTMICPIEDCYEIVKVYNIIHHFEAKHNSSVYYEEFNATPLKTYNSYVFLLIKEDSPFLIYLRLGLKKSMIGLFSLAQPFSSNLKFNINVTNKRGSHLLVSDGKVQSFDEQQHCFKCIVSRCQLRYHEYSNLYSNFRKMDNIMTQFTTEFMKGVGQMNDILFYTIEIQAEPMGDLREISIRKLANNSNILRQHLECPVCKLYMTAPISICQRGHVICGSCQQRCQSCPTCRAYFTNSRVYALEGIADRSELLCQNVMNGCHFIGNGKMVEEHEHNCLYSNKN